MERPFSLFLARGDVHLSDHTSIEQARRVGRDYCDTDLFSDRVKQFVRIQGQGITEHWRKRAVAGSDGGSIYMRYIKCNADGSPL